MSVWTSEQAFSWYNKQGWLVGCNFLPSSCINQIEMFQEGTFNLKEIAKEISWAKSIGFNSSLNTLVRKIDTLDLHKNLHDCCIYIL